MTSNSIGSAPSTRGKVIAALATVWLSTGTTFLALKLLSQEMSPVMVTVERLTGAALLLCPISAWRLRAPATRPGWRSIGAAAISGALLLTLGQLGIAWGVTRMSAGAAAVIASAAPLFMAAFSAVFLRQPLAPRTLAGIGIGFAGIAALTTTAQTGDVDGAGVAALLGSAAAWAAGSLYGRSADLPTDPLISLNLQLMFGALFALPLLFTVPDAYRTMVPASLGSAVALAYLVGAAIAAFLAFNWLNRNVSSTVANTFTYVAPVIALALSALVLGEQVTVLKAVAASLAIAGVALMMR